MKVIAEWLRLRVVQYEDGSFEAVEELENKRCETKEFHLLRLWLHDLVDETVDAIEKEV